jgi:hypothetical protein
VSYLFDRNERYILERLQEPKSLAINISCYPKLCTLMGSKDHAERKLGFDFYNKVLNQVKISEFLYKRVGEKVTQQVNLTKNRKFMALRTLRRKRAFSESSENPEDQRIIHLWDLHSTATKLLALRLEFYNFLIH